MRVSSIIIRLNTEKVKLIASWKNKKVVHFIHVGKTGGSFIKDIFQKDRLTKSYAILLHPHQFLLKDIKPGEKFFFFLRDPLTRYVSGFYSRKRKGRPKYNNPWTPLEKIAFEKFNTPNELAEAISSSDDSIRKVAIQSMKSIDHVNTSFYKWFDSIKYFESRKNDVLFIGFQEDFTKDVLDLFSLLEFKGTDVLPQKRIHSNSKKVDKKLSGLAEKNLVNWYKEDIRFYEYCSNLKVDNEF
jgi:hypothetical protein